MTKFNVHAVVFDLDGLLVDSEPVQIQAWRDYLASQGKELDQALLNRLYGLRVWDTARVVIDELGLGLSVDQVVEQRDARFFKLLPGRLDAMPGATQIVHALRDLGARLALATSGHRRYVDVALDALGLSGMFETEVTGDMVGSGKPAPDIYLAAAERLTLAPGLCLALEDAPNGIASAKSAGMCCLAVPNHMTVSIEGFDRADAVLESLNDVLPWLDRHAALHAERIAQ
ncbi:MAG: HAD family phosphatase [Nitrolancea sp.]